MKISLNGEQTETTAQTVAELLELLQVTPVGVAVAVNQNVVRRADHPSKALSEGDTVEIIRAVQGG
ncbi:sulfur carrier protein ThiS [bacterium]|nr:MAG: sulfur carrier protein ThiS [bacterium]